MKKISRRSKFMVAMMLFALMVAFPFSAYAATGAQDGLELSLTTDKTSYAANDRMTITVLAKNTNNFPLDNVVLDVTLPAGVRLTSGEANIAVGTLAAGAEETFILVGVVDSDGTPVTGTVKSGTPKTGDDSNALAWLALLLLAAAVLLYLSRSKKHKGRTFLSILLVFTLATTLVATAAPVDAATVTRELGVTHSLKIKEKKQEASVKATYEISSGVTAVVVKTESIGIEAGTALVDKQLEAIVEGVGDFDDGIIWEIVKGGETGATVTGDGVFNIPANATPGTVTIRVTSVEDSDVYTDFVVTIYPKATVDQVIATPSSIEATAGVASSHVVGTEVKGTQGVSQETTMTVTDAGTTGSGTVTVTGNTIYVSKDARPGTAEITAASDVDPTKFVIIPVKVNPVKATSITLDTELITGLDIDDVTNLTRKVNVVKILPENTTNKTVIWSTVNKNVATVDKDGFVKAEGIGQTTITATVEDSEASATVLVIVGSKTESNIEIEKLTGFNADTEETNTDTKLGFEAIFSSQPSSGATISLESNNTDITMNYDDSNKILFMNTNEAVDAPNYSDASVSFTATKNGVKSNPKGIKVGRLIGAETTAGALRVTVNNLQIEPMLVTDSRTGDHFFENLWVESGVSLLEVYNEAQGNIPAEVASIRTNNNGVLVVRVVESQNSGTTVSIDDVWAIANGTSYKGIKVSVEFMF